SNKAIAKFDCLLDAVISGVDSLGRLLRPLGCRRNAQEEHEGDDEHCVARQRTVQFHEAFPEKSKGRHSRPGSSFGTRSGRSRACGSRTFSNSTRLFIASPYLKKNRSKFEPWICT